MTQAKRLERLAKFHEKLRATSFMTHTQLKLFNKIEKRTKKTS